MKRVLNLLVISFSNPETGQMEEMPGTTDTNRVCRHSELGIQVHERILTQAVVLDHHMSKRGNKVQHQKVLLIDGTEVGPH
jgi:hypothetical protein